MKINEMNTALLQLCEKYAVAPAGTMVSSPGPGWEVFPKRMEVNLTINLRWHRQTIDCMNACYKSVESKLPAKV